ncbi:MAG TPA: polynucleotide adenylyltransferase PcnB [bacterium]|nr:polynucleotide adenylyltransferase PcnB [bacterium]
MHPLGFTVKFHRPRCQTRISGARIAPRAAPKGGGKNQDVSTNSTPSSTQGPETHREPPHPIPIEHIDPDALKVVRRLKRYGHTAYLVGGCVRDLLLGRTPKDFDVGTSARPRQAKHLFRNSRIIGRRFRLVHVVFGKKVIELATFRAHSGAPELPETEGNEAQAAEDGDRPTPLPDEGGTPSGTMPAAGPAGAAASAAADDEDLLIRSDNVFGSPEQDAFRRDFTVNGLFYDPETEQVIDHVGGLADLERRVLRTIGDPEVRFREDPVRIVRAIKFAARLHFAIEPKTFDAMLKSRGELAKAAPPRLAEEVVRLAQGGAGAESFRLLSDLGILPFIAPLVGEALAQANAKGTADAGPAGLFWKHLEAIDRWSRGPGDLTRATVLACVYGPVLREAMAANPNAQRDPGAAFFHAIRPAIQDRLISRREADRIKLIYIAQRRLESPPNPRDVQEVRNQQGAPQQQGGHPGQGGGRRRRRRRGGSAQGFATRDYFRESVAYFKLDAIAKGKHPETWAAWEALLPAAPLPREVLPFRRREEEAMAAATAGFELPDDEKPPTPEEIEANRSLPEDEEFHRGRRRRRGGRLSEHARERERMERTNVGESGGPSADRPANGAPGWMQDSYAEAGEGAPGEGGLLERNSGAGAAAVPALPRLRKPVRERDRAAQPPVAEVPQAPPAPKLTPQERILRAMSSDSPLINPYTGRVYTLRKFHPEELPAPSIATDASGQVVATGGGAGYAPSATAAEPEASEPYTLDEFEPEEADAVQEARREAGAAAAPSAPAASANGAPAASAAQGTPGANAPGDGRKRRRRRGRRGRGRGRGPGGGGGGNGGGGGGAPPAGGGAAGGGSPA